MAYTDQQYSSRMRLLINGPQLPSYLKFTQGFQGRNEKIIKNHSNHLPLAVVTQDEETWKQRHMNVFQYSSNPYMPLLQAKSVAAASTAARRRESRRSRLRAATSREWHKKQLGSSSLRQTN